MIVQLTPENEQLLADRLREGAYPDVNAVLHAALTQMQPGTDGELDEELLDLLDEAEEDVR